MSFADMAAYTEVDLAENPRGDQQQRQDLLRLVAQERPAGESGQRPEQHGRRPVLLDVEDLSSERDGRTRGDRADGVKRGGEAKEPGTRDAARDVKDGDHGADQREARAGIELVPMSGDKEDHAAGEEYGAEDEDRDALPLHDAGDLAFLPRVPRSERGGRCRRQRFMSADAGGGCSVDEAGGLPAS